MGCHYVEAVTGGFPKPADRGQIDLKCYFTGWLEEGSTLDGLNDSNACIIRI